MKLISQLACIVFCSMGTCIAAEGLLMNYSLWPRRPEAIAKARSFIYQQKLDEALAELEPYIAKDDIGGIEARSLTSLINLPRYLCLQNPHAKVYKIVSGDNFARIAERNKTPQDLLYMLNGTTNPSRLKVGEKLIVAPMSLRLDLDLVAKELRLWDAKTLIVAEPLTGLDSPPLYDCSLSVASRYAYHAGVRISPQSLAYTSSNRVMRLSDGSYLLGAEKLDTDAACYRLDQQAFNAIALLINTGTEVRVITGKKAPKESAAPSSSDTPSSTRKTTKASGRKAR